MTDNLDDVQQFIHGPKASDDTPTPAMKLRPVTKAQAGGASVGVPSSVRYCLDNGMAKDLEDFAHLLRTYLRIQSRMVYHLADGDLETNVIDVHEDSGAFVVWLRRDQQKFKPRVGRRMNVTFPSAAEPTAVEFVAGPLPAPDGFPFDLLLFVRYDTGMEKQGSIKLGTAPSVASGKESEDLDRGEPVAKGEKAIDIETLDGAAEDFDKIRA